MAGIPNSRTTLRDWCLRKLGQGAVKINVTSEQVEDRIDEAIERVQEHHFDGTERIHMKRQITASVLKFDSALTFTFVTGEVIVGGTSGAVGRVVDQAANNLTVRFQTDTGTFVAGELVTGASTNAANVSSDADGVTLGDKDNTYIPCDDSILSVSQVISMPGFFGAGLFSTSFQQALQVLPIWPSGSLSYYFQQRNYLHLIEEIFIGEKVVTYKRLQNRIYIDLDWKNGIQVDDWLIIECYKAINPETWKKFYGNYFLREYTRALIKQQWGTNLTKFKNIVMPGGVKLNGDDIYDQATEELKKLEERLVSEFEAPPIFFVG